MSDKVNEKKMTDAQIAAIENIKRGNPTIYGCTFNIPIGWYFLSDRRKDLSILDNETKNGYIANCVIRGKEETGEK